MLPPTAKRRVIEWIALKIREFAGVPIDRPLNPWALAPYLKLRVTSIDEIKGLSEESRRVLLEDRSKAWSGAVMRPLPDGTRLVFLNPNHSPERQAATLMEEICHVILGHSPSKLMPHWDSEGAIRFRNYNKNQEEVAYAVGAAALVPYLPLKQAVSVGLSAEEIARHFAVSRELVEYRIKVCHLWSRYQRKQAKAASQ